MISTPAIVVVSYNRTHCIRRVLNSLANAKFPIGEKIPLVISIDKSDTEDVYLIAKSFSWEFGPKRIIRRTEKLGLRKHILLCGDLVEEYGAICIFESDLFVSPYFYFYATKALQTYENDDRISGISLYSHKTNQHAHLPFVPISDGFDVYFLQMAASWGQAWTKKQWQGFRRWYNEGPPILPDDLIPDQVISWPETSWLKYFIKYMVENNKFFVFPREAFSTNFSDKGVHHLKDSNDFQVPLALNFNNFRFSTLDNSLAIYDSFFEISPMVLKKLNPRLSELDFETDLCGLKSSLKIKSEFVATTKKCTNSFYQFGRKLKPPELNIIFDIPGEEYFFAKVTDMAKNTPIMDYKTLEYYYTGFERVKMVALLGELPKRLMRKIILIFFVFFRSPKKTCAFFSLFKKWEWKKYLVNIHLLRKNLAHITFKNN